MSDAAVIHCPACGASVTPEETVCPYCEAPLATVACPKCFGLAFKGAKNCPHCGAVLEAEVGVKTGQACPACRKPMSLRELGGHPMEICDACAGVWIDRPTFEALCHDEEHQAIVIQGLPAAPATGGSVAQVGYRPCPACGALMNRVNFGQISGVLLDTCKSHGTFFDPDELRRLVAFLQDGGMDRARARQIEALKAEEQRAEGSQPHGTGMPSLSGGVGDFQFMNAADHVGGLQGGITRFLFDLFLK
jgi:Zn-finger nucleic acid-binding protein